MPYLIGCSNTGTPFPPHTHTPGSEGKLEEVNRERKIQVATAERWRATFRLRERERVCERESGEGGHKAANAVTCY